MHNTRMVAFMNKLLLLVLLWNLVYKGSAWDYQDIDAWGDQYPTCNNGQNQSPIDLQRDVIGVKKCKTTLNFLDNMQTLRTNITNNGHSIYLKGIWQDGAPRLRGEAILGREEYVLDNAHIHWSTNNFNGTEHSIYGQKYAAEVHLLYLNSKYSTPEEISASTDGTAVVAILYIVNNRVPPNPGMAHFAALAESVTDPSDSNISGPFDFSLFLPKHIHAFYSYTGSLTTPPCVESIRWIIIEEPQPITSDILNAFRRLNLNNGDTSNVRPLQAKNNRLVEYYYQHHHHSHYHHH